MKKLLLLLLLTASFSTFALSFAPLIPCGDEDSYSSLSELCKQSPEGLSIDGIRVGKWTWYDEFNRVIKQGNYVNGKKEGKWTEWRFSGYAYDTIKMNYKNDKLDGKWTYEVSSNPYNFHQINDLKLEIGLIQYRISRLEEGINEEAKQSWDEPYSIEELQEQKRLLEIELSGLEPRILGEKIYKDGVLIEK